MGVDVDGRGEVGPAEAGREVRDEPAGERGRDGIRARALARPLHRRLRVIDRVRDDRAGRRRDLLREAELDGCLPRGDGARRRLGPMSPGGRAMGPLGEAWERAAAGGASRRAKPRRRRRRSSRGSDSAAALDIARSTAAATSGGTPASAEKGAGWSERTAARRAMGSAGGSGEPQGSLPASSS